MTPQCGISYLLLEEEGFRYFTFRVNIDNHDAIHALGIERIGEINSCDIIQQLSHSPCKHQSLSRIWANMKW